MENEKLNFILEQIEVKKRCYTRDLENLSEDNYSMDFGKYDLTCEVLDNVTQLIKDVQKNPLASFRTLQAKAEMEVYKLFDAIGCNINIMRDMGVKQIDIKFYQLRDAYLELLKKENDQLLIMDVTDYIPNITYLKETYGNSEYHYDSKELAVYYEVIVDQFLRILEERVLDVNY